jgi:hypothetical protein
VEKKFARLNASESTQIANCCKISKECRRPFRDTHKCSEDNASKWTAVRSRDGDACSAVDQQTCLEY